METTERTYSVLLVSAANKFRTSLRELLPVDRYDPLYHVGDVASARRCLLERQFDIVVISTPLPDEFGSRLALHVADTSGASVLLLVKAEHYPDMEQKTASIEEKMAEIRLVNRAKWLLIQQHGMTEAEAHRFIEKQAMDRCVKRKVIAEEIIGKG